MDWVKLSELVGTLALGIALGCMWGIQIGRRRERRERDAALALRKELDDAAHKAYRAR